MTAKITGNVYNVNEQEGYSFGLVKLEEYISSINGSTKLVDVVYTNEKGEFTFNFKCFPDKNYRLFLQSDSLLISGSKGYKDLKEGVDFSGTNIPNFVDLTCAKKSYYNVNLIHDQNSDSMYFESSLLYIDNYASGWYYGEEPQFDKSATASGSRFFKRTKYLNGQINVEVDTFYFAPGEFKIVEIHY